MALGNFKSVEKVAKCSMRTVLEFKSAADVAIMTAMNTYIEKA
jgi:hypothetical protein